MTNRASKKIRRLESFKIVLPVLLTVILFISTLSFLIFPQLRTAMIQEKREKIRELTELAWWTLTACEERVRAGEFSREKAQAHAITQLKRLRHGADGKNYFWVNDMHPRLLMHPYRPDLEGKDVSTVADPDGKLIFIEFVNIVKKQGFGYVDYQWQWKDNSHHVVPKISYVKAFKPWGWIVGTGAYIEDVTAQVQKIERKIVLICLWILVIVMLLSLYIIWESVTAKTALRESERKIATLMGNLQGMVYQCKNDRHWTMIFVSQGCRQLTGYLPDDLLHSRTVSYNDLIHPDDKKTVYDVVQKAIDGQRHFSLEYRIRAKSGVEKWVSEQGIAVVSDTGEVEALEGFITDITPRKQAEFELIRLAKAVEHSGEAIIIMDPDGIVNYVNPAFRKVLGYPLSEIIGKNVSVLEHGITSTENFKHIRKTVSQGNSWSGRLQHRRRDKTLAEQKATISPILDAQSKIIAYVSVQRDITEEIRMEALLSQAQKMEAIGTLAGGIAHDFNNILSALIGYTEISMDMVDAKGPLHANLKEVFNAGIRAKDLVKQILTFSRQHRHEMKPVMMKNIVEEVMRFIRATLPTTIEIETSVESDALILGDSTQIYQVLMNLCTNAGYAMQETGGLLRVRLAEVIRDDYTKETRTVLSPGPYLQLTVSDTGGGIPPEIIQRIYDPFFTTKEQGNGTGMGLAVVHGIVKSHGGTIHVETEMGVGSTFTVCLPIIEDESAQEETVDRHSATGNWRILFVDDEKPLTVIGKNMLEAMGSRVTPHTSSLEALETFRADPRAFDLIITDMTMPQMTGVELAQRAMDIRPDIPVILCTGYNALVDKKSAATAGIRAFVCKPVLRHELATIIERVMTEN